MYNARTVYVHRPVLSKFRRTKELAEQRIAPEVIPEAKVVPENQPSDIPKISQSIIEAFETPITADQDSNSRPSHGKILSMQKSPSITSPLLQNNQQAALLMQEMVERKVLPRASLVETCLQTMKSTRQDVSNLLSTIKLSETQLGVKTTPNMWEILASAYAEQGQYYAAENIILDKVLLPFKTLGPTGSEVVERILKNYLKQSSDRDGSMAMELFEKVRAHVLPTPSMVAHIIDWLGSPAEKRTEMACKIFRTAASQGLEPNQRVYRAMVIALSRGGPRWYAETVEMFRQMSLLKMTIDLGVLNSVMSAAAKSGDLATVFSIWQMLTGAKSSIPPSVNVDTNMATTITNDHLLSPNECTYGNFLWAIAGAPTFESNNENEKKPFTYDITREEMIKLADAAFEACDEAHLVNQWVMTAYLACISNHHCKRVIDKDGKPIFEKCLDHKQSTGAVRAYDFFWNEYSSRGMVKTSYDYQTILLLCDQLRDYPTMKRVKEEALSQDIKLSYLAWRSIVRVATLTNHLDEAIGLIKEMRDVGGYTPTVPSLRVLHLRLCEQERWDLRTQMGHLCEPIPKPSRSLYTPWKERSVRVGDLLRSVYGPDEAPKITSRDNRKNLKH